MIVYYFASIASTVSTLSRWTLHGNCHGKIPKWWTQNGKIVTGNLETDFQGVYTYVWSASVHIERHLQQLNQLSIIKFPML